MFVLNDVSIAGHYYEKNNNTLDDDFYMTRIISQPGI